MSISFYRLKISLCISCWNLFRTYREDEKNWRWVSSKNEIIRLHRVATDRMNFLKERYLGSFPDLILSLGDTPSFSLTDTVRNIDEMRPGNFVFYDLMQLNLGACSEEKIGVGVACPVVAKHKERKEIVIYGGAVHLSKEFIDSKERKIFGCVTKLKENSWGSIVKRTYVASLSQEHGIIKTEDGFFVPPSTISIHMPFKVISALSLLLLFSS